MIIYGTIPAGLCPERASDAPVRGCFMHKKNGFTLIEMIISIAIIGILALGSYSSISNTIEVRYLDNAAREIVSSLQLAKWLAVTQKLNHRVRFITTSGVWTYTVEREYPTGTWTIAAKTTIKKVPTRFVLGMNLPAGYAVVFTSLGFLSAFSSSQNTVTLTSSKLGSLSQPNKWTIRVFASGSFQLGKAAG
jgi:prepilin-type N-terminal cleavage/methylation domain-containing protein